MLRAGTDTFPAADAFAAVGIFVRIHVHLAGFGTKSAVYTRMLIQMHSNQTYLLEQAVERPKRADVFTERPVDENRCQNTDDQ